MTKWLWEKSGVEGTRLSQLAHSLLPVRKFAWGKKRYFLYNILFRKRLTLRAEQVSIGQAVVIETAWDLVHPISIQVLLEVGWEAQSEK